MIFEHCERNVEKPRICNQLANEISAIQRIEMTPSTMTAVASPTRPQAGIRQLVDSSSTTQDVERCAVKLTTRLIVVVSTSSMPKARSPTQRSPILS